MSDMNGYPEIALVVGLIIGALFGLLGGLKWEHSSWQEKMVERGYAHYCPNSGEWAWKNSGECE